MKKYKYIKADDWDSTNALDDLCEELVPGEGKADTVAGEITRAACQIGYRWWNDGDQIGCGYGRETCNPAARYLLAKGDANIKSDIRSMWGETFLEMPDGKYDRRVEELSLDVVDYIEDNPELKEEPNSEDMWNYATSEDVDDSYDEDEDEDW